MTDLPDEECQGEHSFDFFKHTRFFLRKMASSFFQIYLVLFCKFEIKKNVFDDP